MERLAYLPIYKASRKTLGVEINETISFLAELKNYPEEFIVNLMSDVFCKQCLNRLPLVH